jgi:hypothetical protein
VCEKNNFVDSASAIRINNYQRINITSTQLLNFISEKVSNRLDGYRSIFSFLPTLATMKGGFCPPPATAAPSVRPRGRSALQKLALS